MEPGSRLWELFSIWQSARARGEAISPEELCHDCPELLPELARQIDACRLVDEVMAQIPSTQAPLGEQGRETPTRSHAPDGSVRDPGMAPTIRTASRYRVVRSHARGGQGEVFVALDEELQREVALKEI